MENFDNCELITAMVTPMYSNGAVDYDAVELLVRSLRKNASEGILIGGSTGEEPNLTPSEKWRVFSRVKDTLTKSDGTRDIKLLVGTGTSSTRTTIEETKRAEKYGADAALIIVPPQVKPNKDGQIFHYGAVASAVPNLPIIIYNIPSRTGAYMEPETVAWLANKYPNIIGIKQSFNDLNAIETIKKLTPAGFKIYSGDDDLTLAMLQKGAHGVISVASHLDGKNIKHMITAQKQGRGKEAESLNKMLHPLFESLFITTNPIPVKYLLSRQISWLTSTLRPPLVEMNQELQAKVNSCFNKYLENRQQRQACTKHNIPEY